MIFLWCQSLHTDCGILITGVLLRCCPGWVGCLLWHIHWVWNHEVIKILCYLQLCNNWFLCHKLIFQLGFFPYVCAACNGAGCQVPALGCCSAKSRVLQGQCVCREPEPLCGDLPDFSHPAGHGVKGATARCLREGLGGGGAGVTTGAGWQSGEPSFNI